MLYLGGEAWNRFPKIGPDNPYRWVFFYGDGEPDAIVRPKIDVCYKRSKNCHPDARCVERFLVKGTRSRCVG